MSLLWFHYHRVVANGVRERLPQNVLGRSVRPSGTAVRSPSGERLSMTRTGRDPSPEAERSASQGFCDIPHVNVPPPGGAHFYFPGPVSGAAAPTDPSGAHSEGRDPSPIFNFKGFVGLADRKSTRLNSSHGSISYAVFCLKKKTINE